MPRQDELTSQLVDELENEIIDEGAAADALLAEVLDEEDDMYDNDDDDDDASHRAYYQNYYSSRFGHHQVPTGGAPVRSRRCSLAQPSRPP